jgi:hypothetical protein
MCGRQDGEADPDDELALEWKAFGVLQSVAVVGLTVDGHQLEVVGVEVESVCLVAALLH